MIAWHAATVGGGDSYNTFQDPHKNYFNPVITTGVGSNMKRGGMIFGL